MKKRDAKKHKKSEKQWEELGQVVNQFKRAKEDEHSEAEGEDDDKHEEVKHQNDTDKPDTTTAQEQTIKPEDVKEDDKQQQEIKGEKPDEASKETGQEDKTQS